MSELEEDIEIESQLMKEVMSWLKICFFGPIIIMLIVLLMAIIISFT